MGQKDLYVFRLGVLCNIREGLLEDPVQDDLGRSPEAPLESRCRELDVPTLAVSEEVLNVPFQGRNEAHVIQQVRPQAGGGLPDLVGQLLHPADKRPAPLLPVSAAVAEGGLQRLQAEMEGREGLAELVVEIRREAPAFLFLDVDQTPGQEMDFLLCFFAARDVDDNGHDGRPP